MSAYHKKTVYKNRKAEIVSLYGINAKDTGSVFVQCALLTARMQTLEEHLKSKKKDYAARVGLLKLVHSRKRLLQYLKAKDLEAYAGLIKSLGIRK